MGISSFPSPSEGVLPLLVMNTVMLVAVVKNKLKSVLRVVGVTDDDRDEDDSGGSRARRVSITRYASLCRNRWRCSPRRRGGDGPAECCVCLSGFEAEEEVSELSCKHFFHRGCLDKWFDNHHTSCPLCRSICEDIMCGLDGTLNTPFCIEFLF